MTENRATGDTKVAQPRASGHPAGPGRETLSSGRNATGLDLPSPMTDERPDQGVNVPGRAAVDAPESLTAAEGPAAADIPHARRFEPSKAQLRQWRKQWDRRKYEWTIRPECPQEWCLPQWCSIKPLFGGSGTGGTVWQWTGWHCAQQYITHAKYGVTLEASAASAMDDPGHLEVYLHVMEDQSAVEMELDLTPKEAEDLADHLRAAAKNARFIAEMMGDIRERDAVAKVEVAS